MVTVINCFPPTLLLSISFMFWWLKDLVSNLNVDCQFLNSLNVLKNFWYLKCFWKKPLFSLVLELFLNSIVLFFFVFFWQNLVQTQEYLENLRENNFSSSTQSFLILILLRMNYLIAFSTVWNKFSNIMYYLKWIFN